MEREFGRGGNAVVYLAHDIKPHREVALKVLLPELALDGGMTASSYFSMTNRHASS